MLLTKNCEKRFSLRDIKRRTALLLGERGNLLRMSGAFLFSLAIVGTAMHLFESLCYFIFSEEIPFYLFLAEMTIVLLLALPLCMGLSRMAYRMCIFERTEISDLFYYFCKNKIADAYRISFTVLCGVFAQLALAFALGWLIAYAIGGFGNKIIPDETYILTPVFFLPISGMLPSIYVLPNAFFGSEDVASALVFSKNCDLLSPKEIIGFNLSFVLLILLSFLSLGILFIVYTIPLYLVSLQLFVTEKRLKKKNY